MSKIKCLLFVFLSLFLHNQSYSHNVKHCSIADVVTQLSPSVVNISTTQLIDRKNSKENVYSEMPEEFFRFFDIPKELKKSPFSSKPLKIKSLGSGFLIDEKGHIVTNYHVIDNAQEINVTIGDNEKKNYKAKVIGKDQVTDLALLKINISGPVKFVKFGDSDKVRVGEQIIAIGNAFGFGGTVTSGIISAKGRKLGNQFYQDFLQTDASINKGNSGGPMFNMNGEVVGVNNVILSTSPNGGNIGVGFAIPSNTVKSIIIKLMQHGKVERPFLGITFQPITDEIAKSFNLQDKIGAIVTNVVKNTPADRAGIKVGDIIIKFNNFKLNQSTNLQKLVSESSIERTIPIEIVRKKRKLTLYAKLEIPRNDVLQKKEEKFITHTSCQGLDVINLTSEVKIQYKVASNINGVLVVKIDKESDAYKNGVRVGDVIMRVNYDNIFSANQFKNLLNDVATKNKKEGHSTAALFIFRRNASFLITINLY